MKTKFFALFLFLLMGASISTQAQMSECEITYDLDFSGADMDPMAKAMMEGAEMTMSFKGRSARVFMNMNMMTTTAIVNDEAKEGVVLMDMMGMKMAMVMGEDEFDQEDGPEPNIRETGKTKKIAGYTCKQAFVDNGDGQEYEVWYSPKIKPIASAQGYSYKGINGFPLEMEVNEDGNLMKMKAKEVKTSGLSDDLFDLTIPEGYKEMSQEELMQMGGGR